MVTRLRCDDLFEEFIASTVGRTRELQAAVALRSQNAAALKISASTPRLIQAPTPADAATTHSCPASCQQHSAAPREQRLKSDLRPSPIKITTPRSPQALKMVPVPSPKVHTPDATCVAGRSVLDLMEESLSPHWRRASGGGKVNKIVERWEKVTQELRNERATRPLAMLRSVWLLGQNRKTGRSGSKLRSTSRTRALTDDSLRMGDVSKYEGTLLNHLVRHPDRLFTAVYICMIGFVAAYDLVSFPFILTVESEQTSYKEVLLTLAWISASIWSFDLPMSCLQGFYTVDGVVEMRLGHTCLQYVKSWLVFDILVNVTDWITCAQMHEEDIGALQYIRVLRVLRFLRVVRLVRSAEKIKAMVVETLSSDFVILVVRFLFLLLAILFISHYIACAWLALARSGLRGWGESSWIQVHDLKQSDPFLQYMASLHWCLTQFTPATTNIAPTNGLERLFAIVVVIFGLVMFSTFVSSLTGAVVEIKRMRSSRSAEEMQIRRYMKSNRVPLPICKQIWAYYKKQHWGRKRITNESTIKFFHHMPAQLRQDLYFNVYFPIISQHPVFGHCYNSNDEAVVLICSKVVNEQLIVIGQETFSVGDVGAYMFFLESGEFSYRCQLCAEEEKQIIARHFIAEASLWTKWHHRGTLVAEKPCDVLRLSAVELETIFRAPTCWLSIHSVHGLRKYATLYARRISDRDNDEDWSQEPITDLMMQHEVLSDFARKAFGSESSSTFNSNQSTATTGSDLKYFRAGRWPRRRWSLRSASSQA